MQKYNADLPCVTIRQLRNSRLQYALCYREELLVTDHVETIERFKRPCRIDAVTVLVCLNGEAECYINLKMYRVRPNMIVVAFPDDIIQIDNGSSIEAYAILMSPIMVNELGLNYGRRSDFYLRIRQNAACLLAHDQMMFLKPYYQLVCDNIVHETEETAEIIRGLMHAFACSVIAKMRLCQEAAGAEESLNHSHAKQLFGDFMALVKKYHTNYRGVKFYADKLCLTPNYMSGVIKDYTGKTAMEWVNDFVIVEAKIMLKDTDCSIQEVADRLNFSDQSTFGKYFKKIVGVGPKQYRDNSKSK